MATKDWSDYFAAAYGTGGFAEGMKLGFEKWKEDQEVERGKEFLKQLTPAGGAGGVAGGAINPYKITTSSDGKVSATPKSYKELAEEISTIQSPRLQKGIGYLQKAAAAQGGSPTERITRIGDELRQRYGLPEQAKVIETGMKDALTLRRKPSFEDKPMAAESGLRYSGALQSIRGIKEIVNILGLGEGQNTDPEKTKNLIIAANRAIEGANAKDTMIPFAKGVYRGWKAINAGDEGANLASYFMTTSENILRARTGAAAPEPEVIREYARGLLKSFIESPETWINKLGQEEEYVMGIAKSMRPKKWEKDLNDTKSFIGYKSKFVTLSKGGKSHTWDVDDPEVTEAKQHGWK